jgi:SET domain-containing protein
MEHFILPSLYPAMTAGKGRGVFAKQGLRADTVIEASPVIVMDEAARQLLDRTLLHDYIFEWHPEGRSQCCMALGYLSLYNHSYSSNCEYFMDYPAETMIIKTVRDIRAGEELTINYNGDWDDAKPVWFDAAAEGDQ